MTETARDLDLTYASPTVFRLAKALIALEERVAELEATVASDWSRDDD